MEHTPDTPDKKTPDTLILVRRTALGRHYARRERDKKTPDTPDKKRFRTITPEQRQVSAKRNSIIGKELDRLRVNSYVAPEIPVDKRVRRRMASHNNGALVIGWRVRAFNYLSQKWLVGVIVHVANRKPRGRKNTSKRRVLAIVKHDDEKIKDRAYEVGCLERVAN